LTARLGEHRVENLDDEALLALRELADAFHVALQLRRGAATGGGALGFADEG
jgi:hypothetical protein